MKQQASTTSPTAALVLGAGGLLGDAVRVALQRRNAHVIPLGPVPWSDSASVVAALEGGLAHAAALGYEAGVEIYWCAGRGHVGATAPDLAKETMLVKRLLQRVAQLSLQGTPHVARFIFASSAGAVWAGAPAFPVTESDRTQAVHAYGHAKLEQERIVAYALEGTGTDGLIARISNLYGARQNLHKPQGLLSHLVTNALAHRPTHIFVPLDTARDYLRADVAAEMIVCMAREPRGARAETVVRIVASERHTSIAAIVGILGRILKRHIPVTLGVRPEGLAQPAVLSFRTEYPSQQHKANVTLEEGIHGLVLARLVSA